MLRRFNDGLVHQATGEMSHCSSSLAPEDGDAPHLTCMACIALGDVLFVSLHTRDPHEGKQQAGEVVYASYARVPVNKTSESILFPRCTSGSTTAMFWGVGPWPAGDGPLLVSGAVSPTMSICTGVSVQLHVDFCDVFRLLFRN